ncbi:MAG: L-fucose/L-arabinose isomerase family protein [Christensenellales bacterium]|jgi:L-fucose isomerase-like protein
MAVFGVLISNRSFFPAHLVQSTREKLLKSLRDWGHEVIALSPEDTSMGQTMSYEEAKKCAKLFRDNMDKIDGIIVSLPNFGEETGIADALKWSKCDVPILIQACDDDFDKLQLENRRDAFCGKLSVCNNLYQYGIKYSLTARHTCPVDSEEFKEDVDKFAKVCAVVKAMRTARIAQIGARVMPFRTVRYSEKLLQNAGMTVETVDFSEIFAAAESIADEKIIKSKIQEIRDYGNIADGIEDEKILRQAKLTIAIENWIEEHDCDASAIQCWDSVESNYGCATCLSMSMMGEKGKPSACETDIMGAVSMLALLRASNVPPIYQDWNNNYKNEKNKCINVHCSNYPVSAFEEVPEIENLDILATTLGTDVSFGALKGRVRPGKMTFLKVSTDDKNGKIKCYLGEGEFTDDPLPTFGGVAVCKVPRLNELMHYLTRNGFEHHVAVVHASVADVLEEALGNYMGWDVYVHR